MRLRSILVAVVIALSAGLSGCDTFASWRTTDPETARAERLRLPPDLSGAGINDGMSIPPAPGGARTAGTLLPDPARGLQVRRTGGERWLEIAAKPEQVWQWLQRYLEHYSLGVARAAPELGVLQTDWILHGVAAPRGVFSPQLKDPNDARVADYYVFRLEPGQKPNTTELHVAQRRMAANGAGEDAVWSWRPADPFLEAEMLRGFLLFAGVQPAAAQQQIAAAEGTPAQAALDRDENGQPLLVLDDAFYDAWRRVGIAMDRLGFTVVDRDRSAGQYFVRYDPRAEAGRPERGLLASLAFWRDDPPESVDVYLVQLREQKPRTIVSVATEDGQAAPPEAAEQILAVLAAQLR